MVVLYLASDHNVDLGIGEFAGAEEPRGEKMAMGIGNESPYPMTNDETGSLSLEPRLASCGP